MSRRLHASTECNQVPSTPARSPATNTRGGQREHTSGAWLAGLLRNTTQQKCTSESSSLGGSNSKRPLSSNMSAGHSGRGAARCSSSDMDEVQRSGRYFSQTASERNGATPSKEHLYDTRTPRERCCIAIRLIAGPVAHSAQKCWSKLSNTPVSSRIRRERCLLIAVRLPHLLQTTRQMSKAAWMRVLPGFAIE